MHPKHTFVAVVLVVLVALAAWGERVPLDRPISAVVQLDDKSRLKGRLTAWDEQGFDLTDAQGTVHDVAWDRLGPGQVYQIHESLLRSTDTSAPATGRAWLDLGVRLRAMEGGEAAAEKAFLRAERIDGSLKAKADRARKGEPIDAAEDTPPPPNPDGGLMSGGADGAPVATGPRIVGSTQQGNWGPQSQERTDAAIARLKAFGDEAKQKVNSNLQLFETDFFLCYTDLSPEESRRWASELDRMYNRLTDLFGVKRGENIWLGRCLIFIFRNDADYHRFQANMHDTNSTGSAGMCHGYGNGDVHVAFYRQPNEMMFAHVLVHESVHGFLHRYRSPVHIPSWINEGLAEVIAYELVPKAPAVPNLQRLAETQMKLRGTLDSMFDRPQIEAWQYGAASKLTTFMIQQNKKGYVAFINGIKDGQQWPDSMERNYGVDAQKLIRVWGETMKIDGLRP